MKTKTSFTRIVYISVMLIFMATLLIPAGGSLISASDTASYIVQGSDVDTVAALVEQYGGTVTSRLEIIRGVGATLPVSAVEALRSEGAITQITPNGQMQIDGSAVESVVQGKKNTPETNYPNITGATAVWDAGVTGDGIGVAVIDTGIAKMRGLKKDANGNKGRIVGWVDFVDGKKKPKDPNGHGTHIAGVIANSQKGLDGEWNGVAPNVDLVGVRVADENGHATYETVLLGIQWAVDHQADYNIRVINFSLSAPARTPYWADPINMALMYAWSQGIVVVASAGNNGPEALTIGVPGNNPYVITVGAFTDAYTPGDWTDDYIPSFSSAGPTYDGFVKPDLVAPGGHIVSTMKGNSKLAQDYPDHIVSKNYFQMAGTSQAAASVSGIVALMLEQNPGLTPNQVKYRLQATALPQVNLLTGESGYSVWQQGAGRVFAPLAVFGDINGSANGGMDAMADLFGDMH
jgi:serine protease AprX